MNDEIKEILNCLELALDSENYKTLLDYITNLQQENKELKKKLDRRYYKNEYERIKQENERLKTNLGELQNAIDNIAELVDVPEGMSIEDVYDKVKDYKTRCEEAIEYIKNNWYSKNTIDIDSVVIGDWRIDLLNILQNGSEDK